MMKWVKRLAIAILLVAALIAVVMIGAFYYLAAPEEIPAREPVADQAPFRLGARVGEYRLPGGDTGLLTFGADGGLYLFRIEGYRFHRDDYLGRLLPRDAERLTWHGRAGAFEREVAFEDDENGTALAFHWEEDGEARRAEKIPDSPLALRELTIADAEVPLSGTLFLPAGAEAVPAAVLIHGSGASDRDNLWYVHLACHLTGNGIAVFLPDKRGAGKSGGEWRTASFQDFAGDTLAAVRAVAARPEVDEGRVGVVGISQGGWIAPLVASLSADLLFVVNLSGAAVRPVDQLRHETRQTLRQAGVPDWLGGLLVSYAAAFPKHRRAEWWTKNGEFDPEPHWRATQQPALVVYGRGDERDNVPVADSVAVFERIARDRPDLTVRVFDGVGHGLYDEETRIIDAGFLEILNTWIASRVAPGDPESTRQPQKDPPSATR
jgi:pimeloyl-ACP methyl ester carboxylesterase